MSEGNGNGALKAWEPDEFSERHVLICRLHAAGMRNKDICSALGFDPSRVSVILNDPRAKSIIQEAAGTIAEKIDDVGLRLELIANDALDKVEELMYSTDEAVSQRSAFSILDRAGYGKIEKRITQVSNISDKAAENLREAAIDARRIVDADYSIEE